MEIKLKQYINKQEKLLELRTKNIRENSVKVLNQDNIQEEFSEIFDHKFQTPLHTIISSVVLLKNHDLNYEDKQLVKNIEISAFQLLQLLKKMELKQHEEKAPENLDEIDKNLQNHDYYKDIKNILVVDDNSINRKIAKMILEQQGFIVSTAANGKQAVEKSVTGKYQLILMDLQMPVMGGIEAAKKIRENEQLQDKNLRVYIIALTANTNLKEKEKCFAAGMDGFLSKPFKWEQFPHILKAIGR